MLLWADLMGLFYWKQIEQGENERHFGDSFRVVYVKLVHETNHLREMSTKPRAIRYQC